MDTETLYQELHDAIQKTASSENNKVSDSLDSPLVTKWVCVLEVMDGNGDKWITGFRGPTPNSIPMWDAKGLLMYCAQDLDTMDEPGDDDA